MFWKDERVAQVSGLSAMLMLNLTQVILGGIIVYRAYIIQQPDDEFRDLQWLLFISIVGFFALRSWLGGFFPVPTLIQALLIYAGLASTLVLILIAWFGLPDLSQWTSNLLPALAGPAVAVGGYWLIAFLGKRRLERAAGQEQSGRDK